MKSFIYHSRAAGKRVFIVISKITTWIMMQKGMPSRSYKLLSFKLTIAIKNVSLAAYRLRKKVFIIVPIKYITLENDNDSNYQVKP